MKQHIMNFTTQAQNQVMEPLLRKNIVASAVAVAVAMTQPLPSSEVAHGGDYFTNHVMPAAQRIISQFNECIVFDTVAALAQVRQLWELRYWTAYKPTPAVILGGGDFFSAYTGVDTMISDNLKDFMNANAKAIVSLSYFATDVIRACAADQAAAAGVPAGV